MTGRSDCPINLTAELLGDRWSLIILRDIIFGDRRHFRVLLNESEEKIASNVLAARLRNLVELKGAQMIGCEYCVDLGSQICRNSGFSDDELLALPRYRQSELFTEREKLALDYTVGVMRTPVDVSDDLFARVKAHFSNEQLVEITALLTVVNLDRLNAAFGIGSAGFSDGMVCVAPDRPGAVSEPIPRVA